MPSYENFNEYVASYIREKNPRMASRLLKDGKVPAQIAIEIMQSEGVPEDKIRRFEERAMRDGSLEMTYEGAQRIYDKLREVIEQKGGERNDDYLRILDSFDPIVDHDLIATGIFCLVPEIRRRLGNKIESLYKVVLNVGASQKKEYATSDRQKVRSFDDNVLSSGLEGLLKAIPAAETEEDVEYQRRLKVIFSKKRRFCIARRRCFIFSMVFVKAQPGDSSDSLIRKFSRKVLSEGILQDLKKREFYQKPAEVRKEKARELARRLRHPNR